MGLYLKDMDPPLAKRGDEIISVGYKAQRFEQIGTDFLEVELEDSDQQPMQMKVPAKPLLGKMAKFLHLVS
jgi:hypothetical protein